MRRFLLFVALAVACFSWGADIANYATGFENGTTGINKEEGVSIAVSTDNPRTGAQCLSTSFDGTAFKYWRPYVTFEVPDGYYLHVIGYAKVASGNGQAYADAFVFNPKEGDHVDLNTAEWTRFTASSDKSESDEIGAEARFYRKHTNKKEVLFDDIIAYVSDKAEVDLIAPSPATSASATETEITWTCGSDDNTGIQATLIWKRIDGTAELTLNNQGIYALTASDGPKVDQNKHWELVKILAGNATSYSETFGSLETYAIVHRDLAYNYSDPAYVTTPDLTTKTIYLKTFKDYLNDGARMAVYCYGNGEKLYEMEPVNKADACDAEYVYVAKVRASYPKMKFYRMNDSFTAPWNKTEKLDRPDTEVGLYIQPDGVWDDPDPKWHGQPLNNCISGTWLCFAGEQLTLTATSIGATSYQWYHKGVAIDGATSATYTKEFEFKDAGDYYCKTRLGTGELNSSTLTVKTLHMHFNDAGNPNYGDVDLEITDPVNKIASGRIIFGRPWTYGFYVTDGAGNRYGNTGTMDTDNHSGWTMDKKNTDCHIKTAPDGFEGAFATFTFNVNYSDDTKPVVSVVYPEKHQTSGKVIYFDNTPVNWNKDSIHYRVGDKSWTIKEKMTRVPGTTNLYQCTTPDRNDIAAWHISNNCGWSDGNTIFRTKTGDGYAISHSINYEGAATKDAITIIPASSGSLGSGDLLNNCYFHDYSTVTGMLTHNVEIIDPEHGTIKVSYTDTENHSQSFTSGDRDLAHTCKVKIDTTSTVAGYKLKSLLVNDAPFASGNTLTLTEDITIKAEYIPDTFKVTLHTNEGIIIYGDVTEYIFGEGATLPSLSDVIRIGKDFTGWYDNEELTGTAVTEIPATATGDKEFWAGWKTPPVALEYILGACYMKDGLWKAGGTEGDVAAWRYIEGADVESGTVVATNDITISTTATANQYFDSKNLALLDDKDSWNTSSSSKRTIRAIMVGADDMVTFDLGSLEATKIIFYAFPDNNTAHTVDLTINGDTRTKSFAAGKQGKWHRYQFRGSFTGTFSIKSNNEATRVVVIIDAQKATITFDANNGSGETTSQDVAIGHMETLKENEFEYDDHFFLGWAETTDGPVIAWDGGEYTATSEDVTLYAQWEPMVHTPITLNATGAFNRYTTSVEAIYKLPMPAIHTLPLRSGYVFDGYYDGFDGENGTGTQYYDGLGTSIRNWDKNTTDPVTLYAKWTSPCDLKPNLTTTTQVLTIWNNKEVDESVVKVSCDFDAAGVTYKLNKVSPANPINGCHFEYFDNQIHLMGTPTEYTTSYTVNVTFTIANDCDPKRTWTITSTIHIKPRVANKDGKTVRT